MIREEIESGLLLIATLGGDQRPRTGCELARQAFRHPFLSQKVIASIHFEALKLWLKGISLQPRNTKGPKTVGPLSTTTPTVDLVGEPPGTV